MIDQFLFEKCKLIHGDKYEYLNIFVKNNRKYITAVCKEHGVFEQRYDSHLKNGGCKKCGILIATTHRVKTISEKPIDIQKTISFIEKSSLVHHNKYDYTNTFVVNQNTEVSITCPIHGEFLQKPVIHLVGSGCQQCGNEKVISNNISQRTGLENFILQAKEIHGNKYDYSLAEYINNNTKLKIICPEHGVWEQQPNNHLMGKGCRKCVKWGENATGWTKTSFSKKCKDNIALLYIVRLFNEDEEFVKVGITGKNVDERNISKKYKIEIIEEFKNHPDIIWSLEQELHKSLEQYKYVPHYKFCGYTECYSIDYINLILQQIKERLTLSLPK